jgi:hypothetical protein
MYTGSTTNLKAATTPESITWCNGISESSCCTNSMFDSLKSYWEQDSKMDESNKLLKIDHAMNFILRRKYRKIHEYSNELKKTATDLPSDKSIAIAR